MSEKYDTIMIFQKPESYFFPHMKEIVFSPFGIPERSFRYLIYKVLYILRIPLCSVFWGDWKKHVKDAKQIIIFDYGYQRGMETYIKRINPSCRVFLFFWNTITKIRINHKLFTDKNAIYSTDKGDCKIYGFHYNHIFYTKDYYCPYTPENRTRLFFLGVDKGRAPLIQELKGLLEAGGLTCDIRVVSHSKDKNYRDSLSDILTGEPLPYPEYCEQIKRSGILLDINQEGQTALTMRVLESIYFSKKLITGNEDIVSYDFYDVNNILLLPRDLRELTPERIRDFVEKPFRPYGEEILRHYDYEDWKGRFQ